VLFAWLALTGIGAQSAASAGRSAAGRLHTS
jgi:hypothetical protein